MTEIKRTMAKHDRIRGEILRRINNMEWPPGTLVPHEEELACEFKVARGTIRRAISPLVERGLIRRKKRAGSHVANRQAHISTLSIPLIRHEITKAGGQYSYQLLLSEYLNIETPIYDLPSTGAHLHITALHYSDEKPFQLEDRWINLDTVPEARKADFTKISPNEWLINNFPYSAVRTILYADAADNKVAQYMAIQEKDPLFIIERTTRLHKDIITFVRLSHQASQFKITTQTDEF